MVGMKKTLVLLSILLIFAALPVSAVLETGKMKIYAVTNDGKGLGAEMELQIEPGNGTVWVASEPLVGTSTQSAAKTAKNVAKDFAKDVDKHDYKFRISSNASVVEGPSAGAAMALLIISMLEDKKLNQQVSLTGTIGEDGSVGPIGGAFEKSKAAAQEGIDLFMIPKGEAIQTVRLDDGTVKSINMLEYGPQELGIKVVEVATIDDVLDYAFSDIDSIDVNAGSEAFIPDFVPKPITFDPSLYPMKKLTDNYLRETSQVIESARLSVSTTLIEDPALVNALLENLNSSQQTLHQAEILNDQNYLYSAANLAFLSRVSAMLVKDISENPSILEPGSTIFRMKLDALKVDIDNLKESLNRYVAVDYVEWQISAQQRVTYAEITYGKLTETQLVVVQGDETGYDAVLEQISDYEFAAAWVDVSKDFYEITKDSERKAKINPDIFRGEANAAIIDAENNLSGLDRAENEDLFRRLDSAKAELDYGWTLSALFDAASATALAKGEADVQDKPYDELKTILNAKISVVENKIKSSGHEYAWPSLYLAHSKFFLESAEYYSSLNQGTRATAALRNGISLITLADKLVDAVNPVFSYYSSIDENQLLQPGDYGYAKTSPYTAEKPIDLGLPGLYMILGSISFLLAALMLASVIVLSRTGRKFPIEAEITKVKGLARAADESFMQGKITGQKHNELMKRYSLELSKLETIRSRRISHLIDLDKYRAEIIAYKARMSDLEIYKKRGVLTQSEYDAKKSEFSTKIDSLKSTLKAQNEALNIESKELISLMESGTFAEMPAAAPKASPPKPQAKVYGRKTGQRKPIPAKRNSASARRSGSSSTMQGIAKDALKKQARKSR